MKKIPRIVITPGEPAGIGPELVALISQYHWKAELVICCDPEMLKNRAKNIGINLKLYRFNEDDTPQYTQPKKLAILPIKTRCTVTKNVLNAKNSSYVIETLRQACQGCIQNKFSALVTGPVNKKIIQDSGIEFTGHTEFLAKFTQCKYPVMMLLYNSLRIALTTTHIPLKLVSNYINYALIQKTLIIINDTLINQFDIHHPCIYVCGLNPHAGEEGCIGTEEIDIIQPAIKSLKELSYNIIGPMSADSLFQNKYMKNADAILTMYHDQGLPILKYLGFGKSVNLTLGLPFIRTSVDHGTALNLFNLNEINYGSLYKAIELAINLSSKIRIIA
ncbi:MAG: 4-hydroxythreonine-4-phosphate dehydrogenase PdxA [Wigglesworthia glossinidia]|nr:4-hydroxythreonine-4-phosphate dehydrogenase PdxA [Wigglesworthia glossinidia]